MLAQTLLMQILLQLAKSLMLLARSLLLLVQTLLLNLIWFPGQVDVIFKLFLFVIIV